jgi:glycosyltransferase 2 family protein
VVEQPSPASIAPTFSRRKAVLFGVQVVIVAALCWWLFRSVKFDALLRALRDCPVELTFGAFLLFIAERIVRPCRLSLLFRGVVAPRAAIATQSVAQVVNLLLPMRAGEMVLIFLLRSTTPVGASAALSVVIVDRVMDIIAILIVFAVALALIPGIPPIVNGGAVTLAAACVVFVAGVAILLVARERVLTLTARWLQRFTSIDGAAWLTRLKGVLDGFSILRDPARVALALAVTAVVWTLAIGGFALVLKGVWPAAPIPNAALAVCFGAIGIALLSVPAGIGVLHAGYALAAMVFGAPQEQALAFAILAHFLGLIATLAMGLTGAPLMRRAGPQIMRYIR